MRTLIVMLIVVALALPALAVDMVGDTRLDRHRWAVMFGGGYGKVSVGDEGVFDETTSTPDDFNMGMAFGLEYGYRVDPTMSVEGFITFWMGTLNGDFGNEDWFVSVLGGAFRWRPTGEGFYLRGGFGASNVMAAIDDPGSDDPWEDYSDYGFGLIGSVGYDLEISRTFAAGPRLEFQAVDVGGGVTAVSSSLLFTFTF